MDSFWDTAILVVCNYQRFAIPVGANRKKREHTIDNGDVGKWEARPDKPPMLPFDVCQAIHSTPRRESDVKTGQKHLSESFESATERRLKLEKDSKLERRSFERR